MTETDNEREERRARHDLEQDAFWSTVGDGRLYEHLAHDRKPALDNVADVMRRGVDPPRMVLDGWIVAGELHWLFAEAEAGKTWLGLRLALDVIANGGTVAYFDEELGVGVIAERLTALGADPDTVEPRFVYAPFPGWQMTDADVDAHRDFLTALRPDLAIYDTATDMLTAANLDENSGVDVTRWVKAYPEQARVIGAAQLVLDHVGHADKSRAVGSRSKKAKAKVSYLMTRPDRYDRDTVGLVEVTLHKNTRGAAIPAHRAYRVGGSPFMWEDTIYDGRAKRAASKQGESDAVFAAVPADEAGALSGNQIAQMSGVTRNAALEHLRSMVALGSVLTRPRGNAVLHWRAASG